MHVRDARATYSNMSNPDRSNPTQDTARTDWPVDVQRTDPSGEVDLGQLEYNLSLTPAERLAQNDAWVEFIHIARRAGQKLHGQKTST